jgi:flavodoxin I
MRAIVVYGSFVGNTETMASYVATGLRQAGHHVTVKDAVDAAIDELLDYELILLASPTYEPKMIQEDMISFYDQLNGISLSGRKAAAFGPGDSAWPDFCTAVEMLESRLRERGAEIVATSFTIDGIVEEYEDETIAWAKGIR